MIHDRRAYKAHKCRCDVCKEDLAAYERERRDRLRGTPPPVHNTTGYVLYGCRCALCWGAVHANRVYARRLKGVPKINKDVQQ